MHGSAAAGQVKTCRLLCCGVRVAPSVSPTPLNASARPAADLTKRGTLESGGRGNEGSPLDQKVAPSVFQRLVDGAAAGQVMSELSKNGPRVTNVLALDPIIDAARSGRSWPEKA